MKALLVWLKENLSKRKYLTLFGAPNSERGLKIMKFISNLNSGVPIWHVKNILSEKWSFHRILQHRKMVFWRWLDEISSCSGLVMWSAQDSKIFKAFQIYLSLCPIRSVTLLTLSGGLCEDEVYLICEFYLYSEVIWC